MPSSNLKSAILAVLKNEGYINDYSEIAEGRKKDIQVSLKYYMGKPVIEKLKRVSRPGLRIYRGSNELPTVLAGMGIAIVSTSKGVMTGRSAQAQNLGGEVLCTVE
jgi:small subunit ribosomal protein S8